MVNCVDGLMVATHCCMMEKQHGQSTLWTLFCLFAVQVSLHTHTQTQKHTETKLSVSTVTVTTLDLSFIDWQSEFGGFTCYVANEEDEEVSVYHSIKYNCSCVRYTLFQCLSLPWFLPHGSF